MKIKTKLTLGVGLLFILIILLSIVGAKYINELKADSENILVSNYNTLQYCKSMMEAVNQNNDSMVAVFERNLRSQEQNISEPGELEVTQSLRNEFEQLKGNRYDSSLINFVIRDILRLMEMNMHAIQNKSAVAKETADKAVFWIALTGTSCFLIAFVLLINLPSNIANPIKELTASIKQIAAKNYSRRVHFESHSEFGQLAKSFNKMAQKLEEYNSSNLAHLMMEKKRIETLINNMHDPVIGLDEQFLVIFANHQAAKVMGISQAELTGKDAREVALKNDLMRRLLLDLTEGNSNATHKEEPLKIYADGKESYFEKEILQISISPTGEETQLFVGHVIILRNVTSYKELDFAKTHFLATVSHEFKTPISSIKMSLQLLENDQVGVLNQEQKNLLKNIREDSDRLLKITGELLNMTQVESGNIQLSIMASDPEEILQYAIKATQNQADQKQIKLEAHCDPNLPQVQADMEKTAWVLINLLSNAIRYSYEFSSVYLSVTAAQEYVVFSVKDSGQGIPPEYKDKVFDRYFRIPGTKKEGTGLGLSISKEFIEAQGGQIAVESELGRGAEFIVKLKSV